jgi:hypothetical protein
MTIRYFVLLLSASCSFLIWDLFFVCFRFPSLSKAICKLLSSFSTFLPVTKKHPRMTTAADTATVIIAETPEVVPMPDNEPQPMSATGTPLAPVTGVPLKRLTIIQRIYLWLAFVWNIVPFLLYSLYPWGTVRWVLSGEPIPSPTATFFCWLNSSGDAVIIYLTAAALIDNGKNPIVFRLTARCCILFALFHFSAYWYWHDFIEQDPIPAPFWLIYPFALLVNFAAFVAWGWCNE